MQTPLIRPRKAAAGDRVAVLSPSFAAPAVAPAVHEQAMRRLEELTGLVPVEYPTTRQLGASARDRAAGSTQVHLGPGPAVDEEHALALRAALLNGDRIQITEPGESEDIGKDWDEPAALSEFGDREPTEPWTWAGPMRSVTGPTWGGCAEVVQWLLTAGRFPADPAVLDGGVLLLETSEELIPAREFGWIVRALGERGLLAAVDAVLVARPPTSSFEVQPSRDERAARRAEQRDEAIRIVQRYNPEAVIAVGVPFGHTRPQWVLPYGGEMTVDATSRTVWADYR